jgi:hypothetical protein
MSGRSDPQNVQAGPPSSSSRRYTPAPGRSRKTRRARSRTCSVEDVTAWHVPCADNRRPAHPTTRLTCQALIVQTRVQFDRIRFNVRVSKAESRFVSIETHFNPNLILIHTGHAVRRSWTLWCHVHESYQHGEIGPTPPSDGSYAFCLPGPITCPSHNLPGRCKASPRCRSTE